MKGSSDSLKAAAIALLLALIGTAWYGPYAYRSLTGDDLVAFDRWENGELIDSPSALLKANSDERFRPVTDLLLTFEFSRFGGNLPSYRYFNLALLTIAAGLASYIGWRLSGGRASAAICSGVLLITSRFVAFNVVVAYGIMENAALILLLVCVLLVTKAYEDADPRYLYWTLPVYALVIHTHERFMVVGLFVAGAYLLFPERNISRRWRLAWAGAPIFLGALSIAYRILVLQTPFFVRGARPLSFDPREMAPLGLSAIGNVLGFNNGRASLAGVELRDAGLVGLALGLSFALTFLLTGAVYVKSQWKQRALSSWQSRIGVLLILLFFLTLLAASVSDVQDHRFFGAPYATALLFFALSTSSLTFNKAWPALVVMLLLVVGVGISFYYRKPIEERGYFFYSLRFADSARDRLDNYTPFELNAVYFVTDGSTLPQHWYFVDRAFFRLYGARNVKVVYLKDAAAIPESAWNAPGTIVLGAGGRGITELTALPRYNSIRRDLLSRNLESSGENP